MSPWGAFLIQITTETIRKKLLLCSSSWMDYPEKVLLWDQTISYRRHPERWTWSTTSGCLAIFSALVPFLLAFTSLELQPLNELASPGFYLNLALWGTQLTTKSTVSILTETDFSSHNLCICIFKAPSLYDDLILGHDLNVSTSTFCGGGKS